MPDNLCNNTRFVMRKRFLRRLPLNIFTTLSEKASDEIFLVKQNCISRKQKTRTQSLEVKTVACHNKIGKWSKWWGTKKIIKILLKSPTNVSYLSVFSFSDHSSIPTATSVKYRFWRHSDTSFSSRFAHVGVPRCLV